jgi:hypothetical protein
VRYFFLAALVWLGVASCTAQVERRVDLGDGYDAAMIAEKSNASFEGVGHWEYLRFQEKKICRLGLYGLSPDGRLIAYQEASTGKVFVLDKKACRPVEVVSDFPRLVRDFDWKAKPGYLRVEIYDKEPLVLLLPSPQKEKE